MRGDGRGGRVLNEGAGVHMQSAKGVTGGDGSRPSAALQFEEGETAKFEPVTVRRWEKAINVARD